MTRAGIFACCALLLLCALPFMSALTLPQVISSHMVLQQAPASARVWGTSLPSIAVFLTLTPPKSSPISLHTFSDSNGSFMFHLPPQPAGLDWTLTVSPQHPNETEATLTDVAFGDVFLCSGQSNMQFSLPNMFEGEEAVRRSGDYPAIRLFTSSLAASLTPQNDTNSWWWPNARGWQRSAPQYTNGSVFDFFSAVCHEYGVGLFEHLGGNTPIGLMENAYGGTRVEPWISNASIRQCGPLNPPPPADPLSSTSSPQYRHSDADRLAEVGVDQNTPTVLFNAQVYPLLNVQMKAILWYQGESNAGKLADAVLYSCLFPLMVNDWRAQFGRQIPFFFVVLAPYPLADNVGWPALQVAQLAALSLPDVAVASAQDLGDPLTTIAPILVGLHPRNKTLIAERLLLTARRRLYGEAEVVDEGPVVSDVVWPLPSPSARATSTVILRFDPSKASSAGLHLRDTAECANYTGGCCRDVNGSALALRTSDGRARPAAVAVYGEEGVVLATVEVEAGVRVEEVWHDFSNSPGCALYNAAMLPMLPFVKVKDASRWLPQTLAER